MSNPQSNEQTIDLRRYANRIRDAYTLNEAEGILEQLITRYGLEQREEAVKGLYTLKPTEEWMKYEFFAKSDSGQIRIANFGMSIPKTNNQLEELK